MVEKDNEYILNIEALGYEGEGIAKIEGYPIFIAGALIGEKVKVNIIKVKKNFAYGKLIEILEEMFEKLPELRILLKRDPAWDKSSYIALHPAIITTNAYHVVTNSMMYKPLGGDSFTTKVCGMIQPIKQNCLIKKEIPSYKAKAQINLINKNNAMTMKSMNHYVEKLLKDSNDKKLSRGN